MRKMFRMKYESCNGECYAYSDVMRIHNLGLDTESAVSFLRRLVEIHKPSCGNANLQFRLDVDDELGVFVASFYHYGSLDLFCDKTPLNALNRMIDAVLAYYKSEVFKLDCGTDPNLFLDYEKQHNLCRHGDDKKLISFAITFSGLLDTEQDKLRSQFM